MTSALRHIFTVAAAIALALVTAPTAFAQTSQTVTISPTSASIYGGEGVQFTATNTGPNQYYGFNWTGATGWGYYGVTSPNASGTFYGVGTHYVTVYQDAGGGYDQSNTAQAVITVLPPESQTITMAATSSPVISVGAGLQFVADGAADYWNGYAWSGAVGWFSPSFRNASQTFNAPGKFPVSAYAPAQGFRYAASNLVTVWVNVLPAAPSGTSGNTTTGLSGANLRATQHGREQVAGGDPIEFATGAEALSRTLFRFSGARPWSFRADYNSVLGATQTSAGMLGYGWSHQFEATIEVSGANLVLHWDSTHNNTFLPVPGVTGTFRSAETTSARHVITANTGGGWTLKRADQSALIFDSAGKLIEDRDQNQRALILAYNSSSGRLETVTDPVSSTSLTFAYDSAGMLASLTDATSATVAFTYNSGGTLLIKITNQNAKDTSFAYDSNKNLLSITGHDSTVLTADTYDSNGRAITQVDGVSGHGTMALSYSQANVAANIVTTVTDKNGEVATYTFDRNYNLLSVVDNEGGTTSYTYDSADNLLTKTDQLSHVTTFTYDSNGNVLTVTDPAGKTTTFTYDSSNRLLTSTDPLSHVTTRTYDTKGNLLTLTDGAGNVTTWTYDSNSLPLTETLPGGGVKSMVYTNGFLTQLTDPNGVITQWTYDANGRPLTQVDAASNVTTFTYDAIGNQLTVTDPLSHVVSGTYDARNRLIARTDATGAVTTFGYDHNNNLTTITDPLGKVTTLAYDGEDRLLSVTDPLSHTTTHTRNANGQILTTTAPDSGVTQYTYDAAGGCLSVTDPLGNVTSATFGTRDESLTLTDPLSRTTTYAYDDMGRRVSVTDPLSHTTSMGYDAVNRLITVTDPSSLVTHQAFNTNGAVSSITNAASDATTFARDAGNRLTSVTTPTSKVSSFTYDSRGLLSTSTSPASHVTTNTYDAAGRLTGVSDSVASITITRDASNRILTTVESGKTITRVYDALGRLTSFTDGDAHTLGYAYDDAGNLTSLTYPDAKVVTYTYDANNRLHTVTDWASRVTTYTYDLAGRLIHTARPNGTSQERSYDAAGQLTELVELGVGGVTVLYSSNAGFDAAGRLTTEILAPSLPVPTAVTATQTFDADNRLLTHNGNTATVDADGNLTALAGGSPTTHTYDARNRLTAAGGLSYAYDAEGRRVSVTSSAGATTFVVNPNAALSQVLVRTQPGSVVTHYVYGLGLAYEETGTAATFYHFSRRGDTVALSDSSGTITDRASYGVYGELLGHTGSSDTPFLFNGLYGVQTDANGLNYHRARYYNSNLRRFVNQDVLLGTVQDAAAMNRFAYANGNSVQFVDPTGFAIWIEGPKKGKEVELHQSINVGDPNGSYTSYSFGTPGWRIWKAGVYRDTDQLGKIEQFKRTTPAQDAAFKRFLESQIHDTGVYGVSDICRSWSQRQFERAPGVKALPPKRETKCDDQPNGNLVDDNWLGASTVNNAAGGSSSTGTGTSR